ncbi:protein hairless [Ostrinia furnacalis]|uniref:protein hairless n=1 Tax=Ostrinia furnacalis TaxID=93504 RepID=UPI00103A57D0|nr:protein hairless [Ostrinia furnacalis]XP_028159610.1 protein hairless [Ostrinia furnacalis]
MHIQEGTITTLTTCTKMTEEVDRRHGVNGNSSSKGVNEDAAAQNSALSATGGRLKFFKDGKFILELVRGAARSGERAGWVSVPRKTFWPPAAAPPTPPARPPASLSASDDNSSVHSSPWQRDHAWKQPAPRRNVSKELAMYYCRPASLPNAAIDAVGRRKRRRPHDPAGLDAPADAARRALANGGADARNGDASPDTRTAGDDAVDGAPPRPRASAEDDRWPDYDREKYYHMKLKKPYQYRKLRVYKKTRPQIRRKELARTVDKLRERIAALPAPVNAKLASCRQEHAMVSPRKRILRELERVTLEDQGTKRRAKTVPALSTASYPPSPGPSHAPQRAPEPRRDAPPAGKHVGSYSIQSLLSMPDDGPRRSPHSQPPSLKTESPSSVRSPDLSPSPDGYRHRYSALMASPGAGPARESPPPELARYRGYGAPASPFGARQWGGYRAREEWREACYYPYGYAPLYRAPWVHYGVPAAPPGPWVPLAHPLFTDHIPKDEPTSDLPLNLSKH